MAKKDAEGIDEASPWNTPLSGAAKPKSEGEIDAAIASKPKAAPSASVASGEPQRGDFADAIAYNLAMRKWSQKQTGASPAGYTSKKVSGK